MNKRVNRLLSLAICLAMVITMLPLAVFAADTTSSTITVFCQADNWEACNVYWWGSSANNPGWPGETMSQDEDGIWYYDIPADASNVIFNNGSGTQTENLDIPTDENVMFVIGPNEWYGYGKIEIEKSFYVAGTFNGWKEAADGYQMLANADGTYALSVILPAGEHKLKVTDGTWSNSWGDNGSDVKFNVSSEGEVTITFDPSSCLVTVTGDCLGEAEPLTITSLHLVASEGLLANAWAPSENQMSCAMGVYSITLTDVAAGTYEYKFAANGGWDLSWGAGVETVDGESYPAKFNGGNNTLNVAADGSTVTITFDMTSMDIVTGEGATCSVAIEAPAFEGIPLALGDNALSLAVGDVDGDIWTYTATEDGTLTINITALATDQDGSGTLVDVDANYVSMVFSRNYNLLVNEKLVLELPATVAVKAGDKVNVHIYTGMGTTTNLTLNLAMGEAQEEIPTEPGTADNPIVIESLPYEITAVGVHDLFYTYTATEDCTLVITYPAGNYVSGLFNYTKDEETGTYYEIVTAGQVVSLNPWGSNDGTYTIAMQETAPEVVVDYYAAGDFNGWNQKDDSYKLTADENGVYSLTVTLAKGNYGMKITDGTWDNSWGDNGNNVTFIVDTEGEVTISFDPVTCIVTVSGDCLGQPDPLTITSLHVVGAAELTGADWKPDQNQMTNAMGVYTITFTDVAAGTYDYKFAANGNWELSWGNGGQTVTGESYPLYVNGGNNKLTVDVDGSTVTITFDMTTMDIFTGEGATCTAIVEAPAAEPSVAPTIALKYPTVSFEDVIVLNVYYSASELDDVVEMGLLTFSEKLENANINDALTVVPGYAWSETDGFYYSSTKGIAAKDLGDTVYFALYAQLADGTYSYTKVYNYSPKTYAYNQIRNGAEPAMRPLVVAMLNYGAAAQTYFNYNTNALVNADLTADEQALVSSYSDSMINAVTLPDDAKKGEMVSNGGFSKRYPTISFEGAFCINYYFVPSATPAGDITMYYWNQADFDAAESLSKDNATKAITMTLGKNGEYAAVVDGIAAKDLDSGVYVAFCYSDGTTDYCSGVIGYSIGAYCKNQAATTGSLADLAAATAVYGYYAKQVFGA